MTDNFLSSLARGMLQLHLRAPLEQHSGPQQQVWERNRKPPFLLTQSAENKGTFLFSFFNKCLPSISCVLSCAVTVMLTMDKFYHFWKFPSTGAGLWA
jgi:hypothetical protein